MALEEQQVKAYILIHRQRELTGTLWAFWNLKSSDTPPPTRPYIPTFPKIGSANCHESRYVLQGPRSHGDERRRSDGCLEGGETQFQKRLRL